MFKKQLTLLAGVFAVLMLVLGSCKSKYEKLKASNDNAKKYSEAIKLYNKREYTKALGLFDDLVVRYRGHEGAEDLFYYNAYANYKLRTIQPQVITLKTSPILIHRVQGPRSAGLCMPIVYTLIRRFTRLTRQIPARLLRVYSCL